MKKKKGAPKMENPPNCPIGRFAQNFMMIQSLEDLPANDLFQDNMDSRIDLGIDNSVPDSNDIDSSGDDFSGDFE